MKVSTNISSSVIEIEFKTNLMLKCDTLLKKYAIEKLERLREKPRTKNTKVLMKFYERFMKKEDLDVEYSIMTSLIFCNEFTVIREHIEMNLINFNHFKNPDFWGEGNTTQSQITLRDAIFFTYTTMDAFYPQSREVVAEMLDLSDENEKFNYYGFFETIEYV